MKHLVELTVDIDGERGDATATVVATDGHPFWVPDLREWKTAGELRVGSLLQTSVTTWVQVVTVAERTQQQRVHNLTVDGLHTYHIVVGNTSILVHNTGPGQCGPGNAAEIIDPRTVRFSQDSVTYRFSDGRTVDDTAAALRNGLDPNSIPTVRLVERNGTLFSLDNRRLAASKKRAS